MTIKQINDKIMNIPPQLLPELMDYIEFLIKKYGQRDMSHRGAKFNFLWEGGLTKELKNCDSVDIQHKAMDWR